jgi:hypothetical protein
VGLQVTPPFVVLETPKQLTAAYTTPGVSGSNANSRTLDGRPALAGLQVAPPLVVLKTPSPKSPA